jgi:uncharacterized membrane protein
VTRSKKRSRNPPTSVQAKERTPAQRADPDPLQRARLTQISAESYVGPLPHPALLREFDDIYPGAAKTIIDTFHDQSHHRMKIEQKVIDSDIARSKWGQIIGGIIALTGLGAATAAILTGNDVAGTILGGAELISLVSIFVYGDRRRVRERARKESLSKPRN